MNSLDRAEKIHHEIVSLLESEQCPIVVHKQDTVSMGQ